MNNLFIKKNEEECLHILQVCQSVLSVFDINFNAEDIRSSSRNSHLVFIRALIAFYLRKRGLSYQDIAIIFNRKSHATVMNMAKYDSKIQGRDIRWEYISTKLVNGITDYEIKQKIKWHQSEIIKLTRSLSR